MINSTGKKTRSSISVLQHTTFKPSQYLVEFEFMEISLIHSVCTNSFFSQYKQIKNPFLLGVFMCRLHFYSSCCLFFCCYWPHYSVDEKQVFNSDKALFTSYIIKFSIPSTFVYFKSMTRTKLTVNVIRCKWPRCDILHTSRSNIKRCIPSCLSVYAHIFTNLSFWDALRAPVSQQAFHLCSPIYCRFIEQPSHSVKIQSSDASAVKRSFIYESVSIIWIISLAL